MPIGLVILLTNALHQGIIYLLEVTWLHGVAKKYSGVKVSKRNIKVWHKEYVSFFNYVNC